MLYHARSLAMAGLLAAALAGACGQEATAPSEAAKPNGEIPAVEAPAFYRDYSALTGAALLERYSTGVRVTGTVAKRQDLGRNEGLQLWLAVEGPGHIALKFQDNGQAARKKKLQPGAKIEVTCQINGKPAEVLYLVACTLD